MPKKPLKTTSKAERTKKNILDAATTEFSSKGFDGARIDEIAKRSKANKSMIYHYFDSKEKLFTAVLENAYEGLREYQRDLSIVGLKPVDGMTKLTGYTYDAFVQMPDLIRLLNNENLHKGVHLRNSKNMREMYDPLLVNVGELLRHGVKEGVFRKDIDPVNLYISIASLVYHYVSNHHTLEVAVARELMSEERIAERREHVIDMVLSFCMTNRAVSATRKDYSNAL